MVLGRGVLEPLAVAYSNALKNYFFPRTISMWNSLLSSVVSSKTIEELGIKHGFLCINFCWALRKMLKPEPERRGFQPLPRGSADVNVSEKRV